MIRLAIRALASFRRCVGVVAGAELPGEPDEDEAAALELGRAVPDPDTRVLEPPVLGGADPGALASGAVAAARPKSNASLNPASAVIGS